MSNLFSQFGLNLGDLLKSVFRGILLLIIAVSVACTKNSNETSTSMSGQDSQVTELNLAIWANYLSPEMVQKFTDQTGIKLNISNYSSNEDLLARIQAGASGIDVAVPSDYMVEIMSKQGLVAKLNTALIENLKNVDSSLLNQSFDPENQFSIPYSWTTTGLAINRDLYKGQIESWKDVLENEKLKGKLSMMDDVREVTGAALKYIGASVNTVNLDELKTAKELLLKAKKNIKVFMSDSIDLLTNKEVAVAQAYSSDALNAWNRTGGKIEFVLPKEGATRAIDNLVILANSKKIEAAHKLLNFLISEEANINFVSTQFGGPVLKGTREKLAEKIRNHPALFPDSKTMSNLEAIKDLGDKTELYDKIWTEIKTE